MTSDQAGETEQDYQKLPKVPFLHSSMFSPATEESYPVHRRVSLLGAAGNLSGSKVSILQHTKIRLTLFYCSYICFVVFNVIVHEIVSVVSWCALEY